MTIEEPQEVELRRRVDAAGGQVVLPLPELIAGFGAATSEFPSPGMALAAMLSSQDLEMRLSVRDGATVPNECVVMRRGASVAQVTPDPNWEPPEFLAGPDGLADCEEVFRWSRTQPGPMADAGLAWALAHSTGFRFPRIGDVFAPEDPRGRWLVQLAMARNDVALLRQLQPAFLALGYHGGVYLLRVQSAHLWEAAVVCHKHYESQPAVATFVNEFQDEIQEAFHRVRGLADKSNSFGSQLSRVRNGIFHYPGKDKRHLPQLLKALAAVRDHEGGWWADGPPEQHRATFADEVVEAVVQADIDDESVAAFMAELNSRVADLLHFVDVALASFIRTSGGWQLASKADYERFFGVPDSRASE